MGPLYRGAQYSVPIGLISTLGMPFKHQPLYSVYWVLPATQVKPLHSLQDYRQEGNWRQAAKEVKICKKRPEQDRFLPVEG